jgi:hypothetical protein
MHSSLAVRKPSTCNRLKRCRPAQAIRLRSPLSRCLAARCVKILLWPHEESTYVTWTASQEDHDAPRKSSNGESQGWPSCLAISLVGEGFVWGACSGRE